MATTHSLPSESLSFSNIHAPPPSGDPILQHVVVPDVFVIPPEEEQHMTPPWCYFDAAEAAKMGFSTSPDIDSLTVALDFHRQTHNSAPAFHRSFANDSEETVVMPLKSGSMRRGGPQAREQMRRQAAEDPEISEVVKVRRNEGKEDAPGGQGQLKKSRTFRMLATDALKSIKNVGKGSHPKSPVESWLSQDTLRSARSMDVPTAEREMSPRPGTPNAIKRKPSSVFSQFFTLSQTKSADVPTESVDRPTSPTANVASSSGSVYSMQSLNSLAPTPSQSHPNLRNCPSLEDCVGSADGRASPTPFSKPKSFRARISVLNLHSFFTSSSASTVSDVAAVATSDRPQSPGQEQEQFSPSDSEDSRSFSLDSSEMSPSSSSIHSSSESTSSGSSSDHGSPIALQIEVDAEMRLDSLHFDSLQFDLDDFLSD